MFGNGTDLRSRIEQEIPFLPDVAMLWKSREKGNIRVDGRVSLDHLFQRIKGNSIIHRDGVAMAFTWCGFFGGEVVAKSDFHIQVVEAQSTARPTSHVQRRNAVNHGGHTN